FLAALASAACSGEQTNAPKQQAGRQPQTVQVATTGVQRISIQRQVDVSGSLISPDQARVSSEVAGVVRQVHVEIGREVAPGQPLVSLDTRELEIALRRAESQLRQTEAQLGIDGARVREPLPDDEIASVRTAMANLDDARAQMARATQLLKKGLVSQADFDTTQTRVKVSEAAYQAALETAQSLKATLQERRAAFELAQKKLGDAVIKAPVGGSISERLVQVGEYIRENTPVVTIVRLNPLKLRTSIQERHAQLLRPGLPAQFRVEALPDALFEGQVMNVSPSIEQATRTFVVEVLVDNRDRRLKPGFFAKGVIFTQRDENVLAVPEEAVSILAGVATVFVIDDSGRVRQQVLSIGARKDNLLEVVAGLEGNEKLAASNLAQLATGTSVNTGSAPAGSSGRPLKGEGARKKEGEPE
ncbi:MAG: efflux RND transporter periplasmic adaptor subunit, partial [Acidobacteriota bacterium]